MQVKNKGYCPKSLKEAYPGTEYCFEAYYINLLFYLDEQTKKGVGRFSKEDLNFVGSFKRLL